jgi:hypothetical protein
MCTQADGGHFEQTVQYNPQSIHRTVPHNEVFFFPFLQRSLQRNLFFLNNFFSSQTTLQIPYSVTVENRTHIGYDIFFKLGITSATES